MAEHHLPDDLRDWPRDAHKLLGVPRGASQQDVKRAYTRLIRVYKPDHAPEEFARIRGAYEQLQTWVEWTTTDEAAFDEPEPERDLPPSQTEQAGQPKTAHEPKPVARDTATGGGQPPVRRWPHVNVVREAWKQARGGDLPGAYAALREQLQYEPDSEELHLRLYWLLVLDRSLEPGRAAMEWLADALERRSDAGRALELYLREMWRNREEALGDRAARLMMRLRGTWLRSRLLRVRWGQAWRAGRADVVRDDLERLRPKDGLSDRGWWIAEVLPLALECVAGDEGVAGQQVTRACEREFNEMGGTGSLEHGELIERVYLHRGALEWLSLARQGLAWKVRTFLQAIEAVIETPLEDRERLARMGMELCERIESAPDLALRELERILMREPMLLQALGQRLSAHKIDSRESEVTRLARLHESIQQFAGRRLTTYDAAERMRLLRFCLAEAVWPGDVAQCLEAHSASEEFVDAVRNDLPVQLVVLACRIIDDAP